MKDGFLASYDVFGIMQRSKFHVNICIFFLNIFKNEKIKWKFSHCIFKGKVFLNLFSYF